MQHWNETYPERLECIISALEQPPERRSRSITNVLVNWLERLERARQLA